MELYRLSIRNISDEEILPRQETLTSSDVNWCYIGEIVIVVRDPGCIVYHAAALGCRTQSDALIVPGSQVGRIPEVAEGKIDIPVFTSIFVLAVHDRRNKNVPTDHILVVQELLTLVEERGILSIGQELVVER